MKQFEWLSTGLLAPLPDQEERLSPPNDGEPLVLVYLPWNHRLLGVRLLGRFDAWYVGRSGPRVQWREVFLYPDLPAALTLEGERVELPAPGVNQLLATLQAHVAPPGDHGKTESFLAECLARSKNPALPGEEDRPWRRMAYCGIRSALFWNDRACLTRIALWLREARDAFGPSSGIRLWKRFPPSLEEDVVQDLAALGFLPERIRQLDLEDTNPCVLRNDRGYLIQFWNSTHDEPGLEGTSLRLLLFVPLTAWTDLRGKHGLSLKEMVHAAWGYADAYETWRSWRFYGLEIPTEKGKTATAV